jgi:quercetin dioxygenase-like cupin family protein
MKHKETTKTFAALKNIRPHALNVGITARAVEGERITMAVVELAPNTVMPEHHHENEQLGFVIAGVITMWIGGEHQELHAGDTYTIPSHVPHHVVVGPEVATVVDVFAPVRADWREMKRLDATPPQWPRAKA